MCRSTKKDNVTAVKSYTVSTGLLLLFYTIYIYFLYLSALKNLISINITKHTIDRFCSFGNEINTNANHETKIMLKSIWNMFFYSICEIY